MEEYRAQMITLTQGKYVKRSQELIRDMKRSQELIKSTQELILRLIFTQLCKCNMVF